MVTQPFDGLVRLVDARCASGDWAALLRLRDRCAAATRETGRQLWPAATLAEYRLALLAPPEWAATVLDGDHGMDIRERAASSLPSAGTVTVAFASPNGGMLL